MRWYKKYPSWLLSWWPDSSDEIAEAIAFAEVNRVQVLWP